MNSGVVTSNHVQARLRQRAEKSPPGAHTDYSARRTHSTHHHRPQTGSLLSTPATPPTPLTHIDDLRIRDPGARRTLDILHADLAHAVIPRPPRPRPAPPPPPRANGTLFLPSNRQIWTPTARCGSTSVQKSSRKRKPNPLRPARHASLNHQIVRNLRVHVRRGGRVVCARG